MAAFLRQGRGAEEKWQQMKAAGSDLEASGQTPVTQWPTQARHLSNAAVGHMATPGLGS